MIRASSVAEPLHVTVSWKSDRTAWDAAVAARGGGVFHSSAWAEYRTVRDGATPVFVRWWSDPADDEPIAIALGFQQPDPGSLRGRLAGRLYFDSPPASLMDAPDLLAPLITWARGRPALVEVWCGSFDARTPWSRRSLPEPTWRYEFLVPAFEASALLKRMRKGARSSIRKAERIGVEVTACSDRDSVLCFSGLHATTLERLRERKGLEERPPDQERMAEELRVLIARNAGRLYLARFHGQAVAGCFFGVFARSAYYLLSGATAKASELDATGLALFVALDQLGREGYTRLNLGGAGGDAHDRDSADHGLYSFKKGLGGEPVRVAGSRLTLRPVRCRLLNVARRTMKRRA
jgi:Acetyltransferase (GNAT) domain